MCANAIEGSSGCAHEIVCTIKKEREWKNKRTTTTTTTTTTTNNNNDVNISNKIPTQLKEVLKLNKECEEEDTIENTKRCFVGIVINMMTLNQLSGNILIDYVLL